MCARWSTACARWRAAGAPPSAPTAGSATGARWRGCAHTGSAAANRPIRLRHFWAHFLPALYFTNASCSQAAFLATRIGAYMYRVARGKFSRTRRRARPSRRPPLTQPHTALGLCPAVRTCTAGMREVTSVPINRRGQPPFREATVVPLSSPPSLAAGIKDNTEAVLFTSREARACHARWQA